MEKKGAKRLRVIKMRRSKHNAKRAKGLKILKIIIILAITFLAGIIVTFCQKQNNSVVTDEKRVSQVTSSKTKKHKKAEVKKDKGRDTKVSVTINAPADETNSKDKKAVDKNGLTPAEGEYYRKHHLNPQPKNDPLDNDHYMGEFYSDDSEEEPEYKTNDNDNYYVPGGAVEDEFTAEDCVRESESAARVNENSQPKVSDSYQGGGNYGNN